MPSNKPSDRIIRYEVLAVMAIIALSWADEILDLPGYLFGREHHGDWHESVLETFITLLVAIPVFIATKRLLARLRYVERFSRVCSWCKKIQYQEEWITMEDYFHRGLDSKQTHGICPTCLEAHLKGADPNKEA